MLGLRTEIELLSWHWYKFHGVPISVIRELATARLMKGPQGRDFSSGVTVHPLFNPASYPARIIEAQTSVERILRIRVRRKMVETKRQDLEISVHTLEIEHPGSSMIMRGENSRAMGIPRAKDISRKQR